MNAHCRPHNEMKKQSVIVFQITVVCQSVSHHLISFYPSFSLSSFLCLPLCLFRYLSPLPVSSSLSHRQPYEWQLDSPHRTKRRLLQTSSTLPYSPLSVVYNGKTCILFRARKIAIRFRNSTSVDLTEKAFGPGALVDTKGSMCSKDKAT